MLFLQYPNTIHRNENKLNEVLILHMCGRYYLDATTETEPFIKQMMKSQLVRKWNDTSAVLSSGEIRPTDVVPVIAPNKSGERSVYPMKWGFSEKSLLINARIETASTKPTFRDAWKAHRCIVPAVYYFEWEHLHLNDGKTKTGRKYAIQPKGSNITWLCGLYRIENNLPRFVILTRDAADDIQFIHDRMPLIMPEELIDEWIKPDTDPSNLINKALTEMVTEQVSE